MYIHPPVPSRILLSTKLKMSSNSVSLQGRLSGTADTCNLVLASSRTLEGDDNGSHLSGILGVTQVLLFLDFLALGVVVLELFFLIGSLKSDISLSAESESDAG